MTRREWTRLLAAVALLGAGLLALTDQPGAVPFLALGVIALGVSAPVPDGTWRRRSLIAIPSATAPLPPGAGDGPGGAR